MGLSAGWSAGFGGAGVVAAAADFAGAGVVGAGVGLGGAGAVAAGLEGGEVGGAGCFDAIVKSFLKTTSWVQRIAALISLGDMLGLTTDSSSSSSGEN